MATLLRSIRIDAAEQGGVEAQSPNPPDHRQAGDAKRAEKTGASGSAEGL
jgi:hypothetical protein